MKNMDKQLFQMACNHVIHNLQGTNGIGTISEKTVHSVLKSYMEPDPMLQEIKVCGFIADICNEQGIIEIQTKSFQKLRRKLIAYLEHYPVTIVYPIHNIRQIRWINPQSGEISPPRKSPKTGRPYAIFPELYKIKYFLTSPNLRLQICMINVEEYRLLDGWSTDKKKGCTRCDCIPTDLVCEYLISSPEDYQLLIPKALNNEFSSKDYKKASGLSLSHAQTALNILHFVGAVDRVGKAGNAYIYSRASVQDCQSRMDIS
jgi:hypothetical protein